MSDLEALLVVHKDEDPLGAERVDAPAHGVDAVPRVGDHVRMVQVRRQADRRARCRRCHRQSRPAWLPVSTMHQRCKVISP